MDIRFYDDCLEMISVAGNLMSKYQNGFWGFSWL